MVAGNMAHELRTPLTAIDNIADTGNIGGNNSHEFHVLASSGEDEIIFSTESDYAVSSELAKRDNVKAGDKSPDGKGILSSKRGIEVGHIFLLGDKYSKAMNATVLDKDGKSVFLEMGCYGIGISRTVAAAIEQNNDENGIIWPYQIAPFKFAIIPVNMHKFENVKKVAQKLYQELLKENVEILLDDRKERVGVIFSDMDMIGIPYQIIIGDKNLKTGEVELKNRKTNEIEKIKIDNIQSKLSSIK